MASSKSRPAAVAAGRGARVAIVRARWNEELTSRLEASALRAANDAGANAESFTVAGAFELPQAVAALADTGNYDAVVPLGCLIRGETPHFEVLANAIANAIAELSITYPVAIPFGVLTCDNVAQAEARAGGDHGDLGAEAMQAALELVELRRSLGAKSSSD